MDIDCISFTLACSNTSSSMTKTSTTTTATFNNINIKNLLGELYNKYDLFRLNVVGIFQRTVGYTNLSYAGGVDIVVSGFSYINNYDTSPLICSAKDCAIISTNTGLNVSNVFSNGNGITFEKGSREFISITIKAINTDLTTFNGADYENILFKITGIPKFPIYRIPFYNRNGAKFVLNTSLATSITGYNVGFKFPNISMRNILGSLYDKYDRFVLATTRLTSQYNSTNFTGSYVFSSNSYGTAIMMSGLDFVNNFEYPSKYDYNTTGAANQGSALTYVKKPQVCIGSINMNVGALPIVQGIFQYSGPFNQNTINQFEKQDYAELILITSFQASNDLAQGGVSNTPYPSIVAEFMIYGI